MLEVSAELIREFFLCAFGVCTLGFESLNHGIWPLIRVFGTPNIGLQPYRVQI